jgi:hypothetical protein
MLRPAGLLTALAIGIALGFGFATGLSGPARAPDPVGPAPGPAPPAPTAEPRSAPAPISAVPAPRERASERAEPIPETVAAALDAPSFTDRRAAVYAFVTGLDREGILRELERVATVPDLSWRRFARAALYRRWVELEPAAALAHALAGPEGATLASYVIADWARRDLEGAVQAAEALDGQLRQRLFFTIRDARTDLGAERLAAIGRRLGVGQRVAADAVDRSDARAALRSRAEQDPAGAILTALGDPALTGTAVELARSWAREDPQGALAALAALRNEAGASRLDLVLTQVVDAWAGTDASAALDWLGTQASEPLRQRATRSVLMRIARTDPLEALRLAGRAGPDGTPLLPDGRDAVLQSWAQEAPEAAAGAFGSLPPELRTDRTAQQIAAALARQDPERAVDWAAGLGSLGDQALAGVVSSVATTDPLEAARLARSIGSGDARFQASMPLLFRLGRSDPEAALAFVAEEPDPENRRRLFGSVAALLPTESPGALVERFRALPRAADRDAALAGAVAAGRIPDEEVPALIESFADPDQRAGAAVARWARLRAQDPAAAERFLDAVELAPEWRRCLDLAGALPGMVQGAYLAR